VNLNKPIIVAMMLTSLISTSCSLKQKADVIIKNAKIYTVDNNFTVVQGAAIVDGVFVAVGPDATINAQYYSDKVIDLKGKYVYPGFIDPHCHFYGYGMTLAQVDLRGSQSYQEVAERCQKHYKTYGGKWITGRGWDQNLWETKEFPDKVLLDQLFPDIPVLLRRIDGHAAIANSAALKIAGIDAETKIHGGSQLIKNNEPSGLLIDKMVDLVLSFVPEPTPEEETAGLLAAQKNCFTVGLTSVSDAGLPKETVLLIDELNKSNRLKTRIYAMLEPSVENIEHFVKKGFYQTNQLHVRSIKLYADGALGSRGAALLEPYADDQENSGIIVEPIDSLKAWCNLAHQYNYQVNTHCIGDSANRLMLNIYGEILKGKNDRRWRIEHAQVVNKADVKSFKHFQIIPSIQTTHCTSDMAWAPDRLGPERISDAYIWQDLLNQNNWLINGSDFPIEDINPLYGFFSAIARTDFHGNPKGGFYPKQKLSRVQALKGMTIWAAQGQFEETVKGSIEKGKFADFVVTEHDIMSIPELEIPNLKIEQTWIGGELVYSNANQP
jgi:predicted amidohydrolase YtcJ